MGNQKMPIYRIAIDWADRKIFPPVVAISSIDPSQPQGYSDNVNRVYLSIYVNGMIQRGISWARGITHPAIIN